MSNKFKLTAVAFSVLSTCVYAEEMLDQINVEYKLPPKQEVFKKAGATSVRENISTSTQSIDDIIRTVPGAFTNLDKSSGTVSVNVRGQTGFGRVNTMVDGISQTFFATSGDNSEKSGGTSQFGATIDPAFITSVDIQRGGISGKGGVNGLIGSANFRTIGVDDVISEGNRAGILLNAGGGTNAIGPNYMGAVAFRYPFSDTRTLGFMYAYSWRKSSQNFKVGGGTNIVDVDREDNLPRLARESCKGGFWQEHCTLQAIEKYNRQPYDPNKLLHYPKSHLAKIEYNDKYNKAILSYRTLSTALSGRNLENKNYQLNYQLNPKENLQFELILADNTSTQTYHKGSVFNGKKLKDMLESKNSAKTMDINMSFSIPITEKFSYEATLGANILKNKYSKNRHPSELAYNFENGEPTFTPNLYYCPERSDPGYLPCFYHSTKSNTFQPDGEQRFKTLYFDQTFKYDIYTLKLNANRQIYKYSGQVFRRNKFIRNDFVETGYKHQGLPVWADNTAKDFVDLYGVNGAKNLGCRVQKYSAYFDIINCPLKEYEIKKGGSRSHDNYSASFSADFHPLFSPFVSYAKTHRVPNIKEMYFSEIGDLAVRTDLKSEKAKTIQFGINGYKNGVFSDFDVLGFKILAYQTKIRDYILNVKQECSSNSYRGKDKPVSVDDCVAHITHINYEGGKTIYKKAENKLSSTAAAQTHGIFKPQEFTGGTEAEIIPVASSPIVKMQGIEFELNYDIGWFYANLSYARQKTNQPSSYSDSSSAVNDGSSSGKYLQGFGLSKISSLPKDYGSLDLGTRLFDGKLTLGGIAKYYGKSKRAKVDKVDGDVILPGTFKSKDGKVYLTYVRIAGTEEIKAQPVIFDLYAIYQPTENLTIKGEIQNVFDKRYISPLDANNDSASQMTFIFGVGDGYQKTLNNYSRGRTFVLNVNYKF
ncbi:TonB-dependent receptor domain-containing protein [Histophilus somni]|uniref:TonB-dependent receptor domain-containing protein n=1 Tax=Histophilus somni TaxID=731 RepID=UPI00201FAF61|nr:TonB-dependent receptor [Histophilus somni]